MKWPPEEVVGVETTFDGAEVADAVENCCRLLARMYCLPPMETMEDGVAVTVDDVADPAELTTIRDGRTPDDWGWEA